MLFRQKDGSIQVVVQYKDNKGKWKQRCKQGFKKKGLAKLAADKIIDELKENFKYDEDFSNLTIGQLQKLYLDHVKLYKEFNTCLSIENGLKRFDLNDIIISDLKRMDVQKSIDGMVRKGYSSYTISQSFAILKTFLNYISINCDVKILTLKGITVPKNNSSSSKKALEPNEVDKLIKVYESKKSYSLNYYIAILLACKAGLRAGEMMALTWSDIDFKANTLTINKQLKRRKSDGAYEIGTLKSKNSYRVIPMSNFLSKELKKIQKEFPTNIDNRLISINATVTLTVNLNNQLRKSFGVSLHELRHTFATDLIANGLDFKTAASILGHDVKETLDTYSHVTESMMNRAKLIISKL